MLLRFDIAIVCCQEDEITADLAHPTKFGWLKCETRWHKKFVGKEIVCILYYGLVLNSVSEAETK